MPCLSRSARLLDLIQALRRRRRPVPAAVLAESLGVSLRTIYRDIATLAAQGVAIEGEAGLGYVLTTDSFLPPLMFTADEVDAIILGLRLVAERGDADLDQAAGDALAKVVAVLPPAQEGAAANGLLAGPAASAGAGTIAVVRRALRTERKLRLRYTDKTGKATDRTVWPAALGFFADAEVLAAWCETRQDFRHFRLDRIAAATLLDQRLPTRRQVLLADWRRQQDLDDSGW